MSTLYLKQRISVSALTIKRRDDWVELDQIFQFPVSDLSTLYFNPKSFFPSNVSISAVTIEREDDWQELDQIYFFSFVYFIFFKNKNQFQL